MAIVSSGVIIKTKENILLAHATHTPRWDIPKGKVEPNESAIDAAIRECFEETNININEFKNQLIDLGQHQYIKSKDLHIFLLNIEEEFDLSNCKCHTYMDKYGKKIPETDKWEWVKLNEAVHRLGGSLAKLLCEKEILIKPDNYEFFKKK